MNNLWTYGNMSALELNKYTNGTGNIMGAVYLIDRAYKNGARLLFLTPVFDYRDGMKANLGRAERIRDLIYHSRERYPGMKIHMGSRVRYFDGLLSCLKSGSIFTLADSRYLLLDFEEDSVFSFIKKAVIQTYEAGFRPVIAGITQTQCLGEEGAVGELIEAGAYIQMTMQEILGKMNHKKRKFVDNLMKSGQIHLLSHPTLDVELDELGKSFLAIEKKYGAEILERICLDHYMQIAQNGVLE